MKKLYFLGLGLAVLPVFLLTQPATTLTETQSTDDIYLISSRPQASIQSLPEPYNNFETFVSDEHQSDFQFTSVGLSWEEVKPEGARVEAEIRFKYKNTWSEWLDLEEEEDIIDAEKHYGIASTDLADSFQYRFTLYSADENSPIVKNTDWTFIKTAPQVSKQDLAPPKYASSSVISEIQYLALNDVQGSLVTREQWGADEDLRYLQAGQELNLIERDEDFYQKYYDELQYSRVITEDQSGRDYIWPLQYPEEIKKVVIHHTATTKNLDNPKQAIRDIYHYHAVTRGWGDIGYNYVVDQQGQVYEGRYGGEGVIGAHSGPGNHGSIGIAMLGNYQDNPVPEKAVINLSQFLYQKGQIHDLELDGHGTFRGEDMPTIFGHRDIMSTTCPGEHLYEKLPLIRSLSATAFTEKEKFTKPYDFQNLSDLYYIELLPEETKTFTITLENIGTSDWNSDTHLILESNQDFASTLSFPNKQGLILASLNEDSVPSGQEGTFDFTLTGGAVGKTVYLKLTPKINGDTLTEDHLSIAVAVEPPVYRYQIVEAQYPPELMQVGESFEGKITVKNTGNVTWNNLTFANQAATYTVAPDDTVTLDYTYTTPDQTGEDFQSLSLEIPDRTFQNQDNLTFEVLVYEHDYDSLMFGKSLTTQWQKGENYTLYVNLRNSGKQTWHEDDLKAVFLKDPSLKILDLEMNPNTVPIGDQGRITFTVKTSNNTPESGPLIAQIFIDDHKISDSILFKYKTKEASFQVQEEDQSDIRIKLSSFDEENAVFSANGKTTVYSGDKLLKTLPANAVTNVELQNGKYKVIADGTGFLEENPIRIVPSSAAIIKIDNFNHAPGWNPDLNDNQYRGTLEVNKEDGKLILINELPVDSYLKGLGEVSNSAHPEKIKSIMVAARSYAQYYIDVDQKFSGKPYHLDDDPAVSQKYLGYGLEKRSPNVASAVDATKGKVISLDGQTPLKAPYFNQSDGTSTKSAQEVWGWTNTPYLISVPDNYCDGNEFLGHGVGLSGCGATGMAEQGYTYDEILKHYYTGIDILDLY